MKYNGMDFSGFKVPPGSIAHKVKEFLLWAGEKYPEMWLPPAVITQVIFNFNRLPGPENQNLKQVRGSFTAVRKALLKNHKKTIARHKDTGEVRATISSLDAGREGLVPAAKRFVSARDALVATTEIINKSEIPNTAENRPILSLIDESKKVIKHSNNVLKQMWENLALPAHEPEEK